MEERNANDKPAYRSACIELLLGHYTGPQPVQRAPYDAFLKTA